ncbi:cytochrome C oxidase subunit IV family protein [Nocardia callitridis]|uniref:Cytochrome C oxidase subunit IV family protein n=1 Tax=Nocardia callitridis TaxID=648753 RepID=A0ABP9KF39_9NOCA
MRTVWTDNVRITVVWGVLAVSTLISWLIGRSHHAGGLETSTLISAVVFAVALVKMHLVLRHFMETRTAPTWLRRTTDGWLVLLGALLIGVYLW